MITVATAETDAGKAKRVATITVDAAPIRQAHKAAVKSSRESLLHAKHCGLLLIAAKKELEHGQWLPWLETQCKIQERTAQRYMKLAGGWDLLKKAKTDNVSDLSIGEALKAIHRMRVAEPNPDRDALRARVEADTRYAEVQALEVKAAEHEQEAKRLHAEARKLAKEIEQSFKMKKNTVH